MTTTSRHWQSVLCASFSTPQYARVHKILSFMNIISHIKMSLLMVFGKGKFNYFKSCPIGIKVKLNNTTLKLNSELEKDSN